jgi:hypothetical protein
MIPAAPARSIGRRLGKQSPSVKLQHDGVTFSNGRCGVMYVMRIRWIILLVGALLASPASAAPDSSTDVVRDPAVRVGPIVGGALACRNIVRSRLQIVPAVAGRSTLLLGDENALAKYFAGEPRAPRRTGAAAHGAFGSMSS